MVQRDNRGYCSSLTAALLQASSCKWTSNGAKKVTVSAVVLALLTGTS